MKILSVYGVAIASFDLDYDEAPITNAIKNWKRVLHGDDIYVVNGLTSYDQSQSPAFVCCGDFLEEAKLTKLKQNFQECCDLYTEKFNIGKIVPTTSWFSILYPGSEVPFHEHPIESPVLVGVYYFKVGKGSSPLEFSQSDKSNLKLHPYNGRLIMFPGWMRHGVKVNKSLERGCIGFNTKNILA